MKAHSRSLFSVKDLDTRRHRRALNRRIKPAWARSGRCQCASCVPWSRPTHHGDHWEWCSPLRVLRLHCHALCLLQDLSRFWPRITGLLADFERPDFPFFDGIELAVDASVLPQVAAYLRSVGYLVEQVRRDGRLLLEVDGVEPFVVWAQGPGEASGLSLPLFDELVEQEHGDSSMRLLRMARRD
jgi:hypothetical protein